MRGHGAFLNDTPIHASNKPTLDGAKMIASGGLFKKKIWQEPWPEVTARWVNSVAYRLALVACGEGDATISLTAKAEWDLAASAVIMDEAGGITTDHRGNPHAYNRENPKFPSLVASGKALHPAADRAHRPHRPLGHIWARCRRSPALGRGCGSMAAKGKTTTGGQQLLHLVFGGELTKLDKVEFQDLKKLDIIGIYPNYALAYDAWKDAAQRTVDDAHMRYFIVHLHRLLDPEHPTEAEG